MCEEQTFSHHCLSALFWVPSHPFCVLEPHILCLPYFFGTNLLLCGVSQTGCLDPAFLSCQASFLTHSCPPFSSLSTSLYCLTSICSHISGLPGGRGDRCTCSPHLITLSPYRRFQVLLAILTNNVLRHSRFPSIRHIG